MVRQTAFMGVPELPASSGASVILLVFSRLRNTNEIATHSGIPRHPITPTNPTGKTMTKSSKKSPCPLKVTNRSPKLKSPIGFQMLNLKNLKKKRLNL